MKNSPQKYNYFVFNVISHEITFFFFFENKSWLSFYNYYAIYAVEFNFPINRVSYYLSNFEKDLQSKDVETLKEMYTLRE